MTISSREGLRAANVVLLRPLAFNMQSRSLEDLMFLLFLLLETNSILANDVNYVYSACNFVSEPFKRMSKDIFSSFPNSTYSRCGMECTKRWECRSFNLIVIKQGIYTCELTRTDKYNSPQHLVKSTNSFHFFPKVRKEIVSTRMILEIQGNGIRHFPSLGEYRKLA